MTLKFKTEILMMSGKKLGPLLEIQDLNKRSPNWDKYIMINEQETIEIEIHFEMDKKFLTRNKQ